MLLIIDASSISSGGGLTHLRSLLSNTTDLGVFEKVELWGSKRLLRQIKSQPWLTKKTHSLLNSNHILRSVWRKFILTRHLKTTGPYIIFSLGANCYPAGVYYVAIMQNLLPFERTERKRYPLYSKTRLRLFLLSLFQRRSLSRANGIILLTQAATTYLPFYKSKKIVVIPHGIALKKSPQPKKLSKQSHNTYKLLYVSTVEIYKHQNVVVEAISLLNAQGYRITLDIVGEASSLGLSRLNTAINQFDPSHHFVHYRGELKGEALTKLYQNADLFISASTCETFGFILLEAMCFGVPIIAYDMLVNREILRDAGVYFKEIKANQIAQCLKNLINNPHQYTLQSQRSLKRVKVFSIEKTTKETIIFLGKVALASFIS